MHELSHTPNFDLFIAVCYGEKEENSRMACDEIVNSSITRWSLLKEHGKEEKTKWHCEHYTRHIYCI